MRKKRGERREGKEVYYYFAHEVGCLPVHLEVGHLQEPTDVFRVVQGLVGGEEMG